MNLPQELAFRPAHELARLLRQREIGAVELLQLYLDRVQRLNPALNAVVVQTADTALQRAKAADTALTKGESWGPLHGLPMTVKESFNVPGLPTTWGHEAMKGNIAKEPAVTVQRLQDAGAIVFGKTNVPVQLSDWQTFNPVYGTTNNPWDVTRVPGGSSGGSAAALAAGLTGLELGSDIGASIRNPAHFCGVWGHKPTWGVVPVQGHQLPDTECADALDIGVVGPLARSAFDLSLAMDILANPLASYGPTGWTPTRWRDRGMPPSRMRIAVVKDDACAEVDATVQHAIDELIFFLRAHGVEVDEEARPVDSREAYESYIWMLRAATGTRMDERTYAQAQQLGRTDVPNASDYGVWIARAGTSSHQDWARHNQIRHKLVRQWATFFERFDLLICPTATVPAFKHNQTGQRWQRMLEVNGRQQPTTEALFWAGYPSLPGLPATAVPLALSPHGLPIGAQVIGPAFGDPICLRFAQWLETEYRSFVPPPGFA